MNRRSFLKRSAGGVLFFPAVHLTDRILGPVLPELTSPNPIPWWVDDDLVGLREDLADLIYRIDKQEHPFMTNLQEPVAPYHEWVRA